MRPGQLFAMIRYELVMQRRQRLLIGVVLGTIALPLLMYLLFGQSNAAEVQRAWTTSGGIPSEAALQVTTRYAILYSATTMYMITLLILPVVSADVIVKDRQHGVRELIDGLPLTPGTYLAGKVLGWWTSAAIGLLVAMVVVAAGLSVLIGPFDLAQFALAWIATAWGIGLVNSALSLLLAAGQPTRRRAIVVGVLFAAVCLFANITLLVNSGIWWDILSPGRQAVSMHFFLLAFSERLPGSVATTEQVIWSLTGGVLEVAGVWAAAWLWLRRKA